MHLKKNYFFRSQFNHFCLSHHSNAIGFGRDYIQKFRLLKFSLQILVSNLWALEFTLTVSHPYIERKEMREPFFIVYFVPSCLKEESVCKREICVLFLCFSKSKQLSRATNFPPPNFLVTPLFFNSCICLEYIKISIKFFKVKIGTLSLG